MGSMPRRDPAWAARVLCGGRAAELSAPLADTIDDDPAAEGEGTCSACLPQ